MNTNPTQHNRRTEMKPHWTVKTTTRQLGIKCDNVDDARAIAKSISDENPVIEYVRKIGGITVITPVEIEPT
jgi:hypothetical protein